MQVIEDITVQLFAGLMVVLLFVLLLSRFKILRNILMRRESSTTTGFIIAIFFGIIGILGTYNGLHVSGAIANTRAIGPIVAGLVGGPGVGSGAGIIAGVSRYFMGGFTAGTSAFSTILEGFLAGLYYKKIRHKKNRWAQALAITLALETAHMILLVIIPKPLKNAIELVRLIGPPMIVINSLGVAAFVAILDSVYNAQEKVEAMAAQLALQIANGTLPYLRKGLNPTSAQITAELIFDRVEGLGAVAVTSCDRVLAFIGRGSDHHFPGNKALTRSTLDVLISGEYKLCQEKEEIGCPVADCPLSSKVVVPLKENNEIIGALVLYKLTKNSITPFERELALGLAQLFSTQLEISRGQHQAQLLAQAEIRALQAQINPHFLFNALNTIVYYCRKEPETARDLLVHLGHFYRNNLNKLDNMVDLETEIKHIDSYVKIEQARFSGKLDVRYNIDKKCNCMLPPLILQPIVENAIKHGVLPKKNGGRITVTGKFRGDRINMVVEDNGVGMTADMVKKALKSDPGRKNIGICNVNSRLLNIYGSDFGLQIKSKPGKGTRVTISIPLRKDDVDGVKEAESDIG